MSTFKIGPIQEAWLTSLENHPERQMKGFLGEGTDENYRACCLGEGLITLHRLKKLDFNPFAREGTISDKMSFKNLESYELLGLKSSLGSFSSKGEATVILPVGNHRTFSLAGANDRGATWPEIAAFIRANPETVFNKSV